MSRQPVPHGCRPLDHEGVEINIEQLALALLLPGLALFATEDAHGAGETLATPAVICSSTRRFSSRPSSVSLSATGLVSP